MNILAYIRFASEINIKLGGFGTSIVRFIEADLLNKDIFVQIIMYKYLFELVYLYKYIKHSSCTWQPIKFKYYSYIFLLP